MSAFQSYQSKQINPDLRKSSRGMSLRMKFQSYQSKQINPDIVYLRTDRGCRIACGGFNRINPNRSIPTATTQSHENVSKYAFQSYQSKQINPDLDYGWLIIAAIFFMFQSYQSKQINPDAGRFICGLLALTGFQSYQSKQINPDPSQFKW